MLQEDWLDPDKIRENLPTRHLGHQVLVFESTASTNDIAAAYARNAENHGLVVFAEHQSCGRGRADHHWIGGQGDSLLCSILLTRCPLRPGLLSLSAAVATAEGIGCHARIKWPNDLMIEDRKVAGILLESRAIDGGTAYILGIGINCHQGIQDFPIALQTSATSLDIEAGTVVDRVGVARRILVALDYWLHIAGIGEQQIVERWCSLSIQLGHRVTLVYDGKRYRGNCIGVDPAKGLILQLDHGGVRMFDAALSSVARD
jgi:BirA family transcriptional regulator, biotin operon repressor / biotin---[acetyl-CoA-carboxylase] ligase